VQDDQVEFFGSGGDQQVSDLASTLAGLCQQPLNL